MDIDKNIDPKRFYSLGEIVREGIIPGVDSIPKASRLVRTDQLTNKVLRAVIVSSAAGHVHYKVKGSNIIRFLAETENG